MALADCNKLPVDTSKQREKVKSAAFRWTFQKYNAHEKVQKIVLNAIMVLFDCRVLVPDDSDILTGLVDNEYLTDDSNNKEIKEKITTTDQRQAATIMVATKADYWLPNHHVGQVTLSGCAKKAHSVMLSELDATAARNLFHTLGHWQHWNSAYCRRYLEHCSQYPCLLCT